MDFADIWDTMGINSRRISKSGFNESEDDNMEAIRKYIDASSLMSVIALPEKLRNRKLEVLIFPADEEKEIKGKDDVESVVQSLIGVIPDTDMSLEDIREERRQR